MNPVQDKDERGMQNRACAPFWNSRRGLQVLLHRERGMTVIEIVIALAVVAILFSAAVVVLRSSGRSQVRDATTRMAAAMRYAHDRAVGSGDTVRLHVNLDQQGYRLEKKESPPDPSNSMQDPWSTPPGAFELFQNSLVPPVALQTSKTRIQSVKTSRSPTEQNSGTVDIYFYPDGRTDAAWICLAQWNAPGVSYALQMKPSSGKVLISADCPSAPPQNIE